MAISSQFTIQLWTFVVLLALSWINSANGFSVNFSRSLNGKCDWQCEEIDLKENMCSGVELGRLASSLNTFGNCVVVWDSYGCKGNSIKFDARLAENMNSLCTQNNLHKCKYGNEIWSYKVRSVSDCNFRKTKLSNESATSTKPCEAPTTVEKVPFVVNCPVGSWAIGIRAEAKDLIVLECLETASGNTTSMSAPVGTILVGITGAINVKANNDTIVN